MRTLTLALALTSVVALPLMGACFPQLPPEIDDTATADTAATDTAATDTAGADTAGADTAGAETTVGTPRVVAREPAPNATSAANTVTIRVTFDRLMELPDPHELVIQSPLHGRIAGQYTIDQPDRVDFRPLARLTAGDHLQVSLTTLIRAIDGQFLADPETWRFRVATSPGRGVLTLLPTIGSTGWDLAAGDLDGDGRLDLATVSGPAGTGVRALFNHPDDGLGSSTPIDLQTSATALALGDFDGDGDVDIVVTSATSVGSVFLNDGAGRFTKKDNAPVGASQATALVAADLDGDGDLDLIALTDRAVILYNNGDATFAAGPRLPVGPSPSGVAVDDLDGDGRLDFVAVSNSCCAGDSEAFVYTTGSGGFTQRTYAIGDGTSGVVTGDFNGDGHVDFATLGGLDRNVLVFVNDGSGDFADGLAYGITSAGNDLVVGDIDGDGLLDLVALVTTGEGESSVIFLRNQGNAVFTNHATIPLGVAAIRLTLADLDGDGDLDVFAIGTRGIHPLENRPVAAVR